MTADLPESESDAMFVNAMQPRNATSSLYGCARIIAITAPGPPAARTADVTWSEPETTFARAPDP